MRDYPEEPEEQSIDSQQETHEQDKPTPYTSISNDVPKGTSDMPDKAEDTSSSDEPADREIESLGFKEELRPEIWSSLDKDNRVETLRATENDLAAEQGRTPAQVHEWQTDARNLGEYDPAQHSIHINSDLVSNDDPRQAVDTLAHESRHAFQYHAINNPGAHFDDAKVEAWRQNFSDYKEPGDDFEAYWNQPVEVDARLYADSVVQGLYGSGEREEDR
jgi:hypothetical protein